MNSKLELKLAKNEYLILENGKEEYVDVFGQVD